MTEVYFEWECGTIITKEFISMSEFNKYVDNELDKNYWEGSYKVWSNNPEWIF